MNQHEPVSYDHVDLGSWLLILEKVAETQKGQPWGNGKTQLIRRSLPGKLRGAADWQQRHSIDAGGDRKDRKDHTCSCGVKHWLGGCGKASQVGGTEEIGKQVRRRYRSKAGEQRPQEKGAKSLDSQHISGIQTDTSHIYGQNRRSLVTVPAHVITIPVIPNGLSPTYPEICKSSNGWLDKMSYTGSGLEG